MKDHINFLINTSPPYSADPFEFDSVAHHLTFYSVLGTLVSNHSNMGVKGMIAESWSNKDNFKSWSFIIRDGLFFEDGSPIDSKAVANSFKRIISYSKGKGSELEIFKQLVGISVSGREITFEFSKSQKELLETLSFGTFAIVHESDYDSETGEWLNPKKVTSSNGYRISRWDDQVVELELREDSFKNLGHTNKFKKITLDLTNQNKNYDIVLGSSLDKDKKGMSFKRPNLSNIAYFSCVSWKDQASFLSDRTNRIKLRDGFYSYLQEQGVEIVKSFFPLSIPGVKEFESASNLDGLTDASLRIPMLPKGNLITRSLADHFIAYMNKVGLAISENAITMAQMKENLVLTKGHDVDITPFFTGLSLDYPRNDIKFMFLSKEGIRLPDETGEIVSMLDDDNFNIQSVNTLLWEQGIIWPILHFAMGIWASDEVDFSQYNQVNDPINFMWLGSVR